MSSSMKGRVELDAFLAALPENLEKNILRGALRAGAEVIADDARERCRSSEVRETIGTTSKSEPGIVVAKVQTKGKAAYKAPWLEWGTASHFISVDEARSGGRTIKRINIEVKRGSLVIGGKFVGKTVHHPGATAHPFMRPALDAKQGEAVNAIGAYIAKRLTVEGLAAPAGDEGPEE